MPFNSRTFETGLFAIAVLLAANVRPAIAQGDVNIQPSLVYTYARYYAPYAIQAGAAYLPVNELHDRRGKSDADGYGADVNYVIQNSFSDQLTQKRAREAFKHWRYQFGSDLTCYDPADGPCQAAPRPSGWWPFAGIPAFQVWARSRFPSTGHGACTEVSIAFRGTGRSVGDWISNFDRFGSPFDDYYHQLRSNLDSIISTIRNLDCYKRARYRPPQIVSTGHSLGGGLAQFAALANSANGPRIAKVFAFDPSPVTGAHLVKEPLRTQNSNGLTIDRVYESGEILSYLRAAIEEYPSAKSACNPLVRTVKVAAATGGNPVQLHAMSLLAGQIVQLSYNGDTPLAYATPPSPANCNIRYHAPATDQDDVLVADAGRRPNLIASARTQRGRSMSRLAGANPPAARARNSYEVAARSANAWAYSPLPAAQ